MLGIKNSRQPQLDNTPAVLKIVAAFVRAEVRQALAEERPERFGALVR